MIPLLIDASVWIAAVDSADPQHLDSAGLLDRAARGDVLLSALDLTLYELANVAAVRWNSADSAEALSARVVQACKDRVIRVDSELMARAAEISVQQKISVYDAAHVAAARACKWPLISCDHRDLVSKGLADLPGSGGSLTDT